MRHWLFFILSLSIAGAAGADSPGPYQPLVFLAGSCWKGNMPTAGQTDEHCFTWMYGGKFLRDRHVVRAAGQPDHLGESIYFWNSEARQLEYLYVESDGGFSRGVVSVQSGEVVFPPTTYIEEGHTSSYRSRWREAEPNAYVVVTEFQSGDSWKEGWHVHMVRNGKASP